MPALVAGIHNTPRQGRSQKGLALQCLEVARWNRVHGPDEPGHDAVMKLGMNSLAPRLSPLQEAEEQTILTYSSNRRRPGCPSASRAACPGGTRSRRPCPSD